MKKKKKKIINKIVNNDDISIFKNNLNILLI